MVFHLYGLIIGVAMWVGWEIVSWVGKKEKISEATTNRVVMRMLIMGIVGARVYHVIDQWPFYEQHWELIPQLWRGGLGIWGGLIGGMIGVGRNKKMWDAAALALPFSQAIGRWGNWVNQELYGLPTTLPWGIYIKPENRLKGYEQATTFQPLFAYEAGLNLLLGAGLWWLYRTKRFRVGQGLLAAGYVSGYAIMRFGLEPLRINPWRIAGLPVAQIMATVMMGISIGYWWRHTHAK